MTIRTYSELAEIDSYEDRFDYLALKGVVGESTFGFERHRNQRFYRSLEWRRTRDVVIARDWGCDLGIRGFDIRDRIIIHHMNPLRPINLKNADEDALNPEYLISVTHNTHNAIHYGDKTLLALAALERSPGDTALWGKRTLRRVA